MNEGMERELILLRTKVEVRSWALRASLALNVATLIALVTIIVNVACN